MPPVRYLLLQVRNADDPMLLQEPRCFARALRTNTAHIAVFDLLTQRPEQLDLAHADVLLLGGSGHYSVAKEGAWLDHALDSLRVVHASGKPAFASCWGFQAMARAMGGRVVNDLTRAEIGTHELQLTEAGRTDPVFAPLGPSFKAQMGHEDLVVDLPPGTTLLASSAKVRNQAYRFDDRPIYCTQFHPELNCDDLLQRVQAYPHYVQRIAGLPPDRFPEMIEDTPAAEAILPRFVEWALTERCKSKRVQE
jgi:GMP synthase (glutamine-hydrolysing)